MSSQTVRQFITLATVLLFAVILIPLNGCDVSSRRDMRKAEKMLKKADKANAEHWAETEYKKAQVFFEEAMELGRARKINESRDKAEDAFLWAEDAYMLAIARYEEMEKEKESLNTLE